ncbi:MAG: polysaccharide biosynthesis protein, partial [Acidobacteria bacterium]|nr:polysaccharide biosynthesis protein [Acidobacteriota bacterium]
HNTLIPRTGGLAILASLALGFALIGVLIVFGEVQISLTGRQCLWVIATAFAVAAISLWSDLTELHPVVRLIVHGVAAAGVAFGVGVTINVITFPGIGPVSLGWLAVPITILFLLWMANLYNFMDGMDGFAGGMTVLGFGFLGYVARDGNSLVPLLAVLTVGAAGGFLLHNKPPARIFMGDVGSIMLGFLAGSLSVIGMHQGLFDFWVPVLIFSPFIVDATVTLLRRLFRGEKIWQAHREHYYQRLVLSGWSHRKTVLAECCLMISCGLSAVAYIQAGESARLAILLTWVLIYVALILGVRRVERRSKSRMLNNPEIMNRAQKSGNGLRLETMNLPRKQIQFGLDLIILASAFTLAYLVRFEFEIPREYARQMLNQLPYVVLVQLVMLILVGVYTFVWRYTGFAEVKSFVKAAMWSVILLVFLRLWLPERLHGWKVPFSVILMDTALAFGGILLLRLSRRSLYEHFEKREKLKQSFNRPLRPVLLIGAGHAGVLAAKEIQGRGDINLDVKGFIDDDPKKQSSVIHRVRVVGTTQDLPRLVRKLEIDHVVITIAEASRQEMRRIVEVCERIPVRVRIIPGLYEILQGNVEVSRIRDVQIEDLLGRDPVRLEVENVREFLTGKVVMVTGAGGSIGSELARQVALFQPSSLLLVERAEFALFNINRELKETWPTLSIVPLVADVGEEVRMRSIFKDYRPKVVVHAAAHKHVPMMETNPMEAVKNNVLATNLLGELAGEFGVEVFVLISTDKAVRPTSVMGASKRVAELVVQNLGQRFDTRFVTVRFGNVIGSAGSVLPIFREQIRKGGPVTVTHPDMVRYFLTIPEAVQLVLQASAMAQGGEIYILDMGEPVRILDLAKDTITLSGFKPFEDIDIVFTGIRPGEKLFEELEMTEEHLVKTRHPKIFIGKIGTYPDEKVRHALQQLAILSQNGQEQELRRFFNELLPEAHLKVTSDTVTPAAKFATSAAEN